MISARLHLVRRGPTTIWQQYRELIEVQLVAVGGGLDTQAANASWSKGPFAVSADGKRC